MKIIFYDAKQYDIDSFEKQRKNYPDIESVYLEADLTEDTARLAEGCEGVCAFVSSTITGSVLRRLHEHGVKLLLMRCAGYNNVDIKAADKYGRTRHGACACSHKKNTQGLYKGKREQFQPEWSYGT